MKEEEKVIRQRFVELLGEEEVQMIERDNWVDFKAQPNEYYPGNIITINFKEKDGKRDTVIFMSINYSEDRKTWWTESTVGEEQEFPSYQEAIDDYSEKEDDILDNGDTFVDFN